MQHRDVRRQVECAPLFLIRRDYHGQEWLARQTHNLRSPKRLLKVPPLATRLAPKPSEVAYCRHANEPSGNQHRLNHLPADRIYFARPTIIWPGDPNEQVSHSAIAPLPDLFNSSDRRRGP